MNRTAASSFLRLLAATAAAAFLLAQPASALAICGDFELDNFEECDDGNTLDGDCCAADCTLDSNGTPCDEDSNECTVAVCNGEGFCNHDILDGAPCDDGSSCTTGDTCNSDGFCVPSGFLEDGDTCANEAFCGGFGHCFEGGCFGDPADCDGFGDACHAAFCNTKNGTCESIPKLDGAPCDTGFICTDPGECQSGECIEPQVDCSEFDGPCTMGLCEPEANGCYAAWKENGIPCEDGDQCTVSETCDDGECILGEQRDCSSFADQCNDAACDSEVEGGCIKVPKEFGATNACNDGSACTTGDECVDGECVGTPVDCSGLDTSCRDGVCIPQTGQCGTLAKDNGTTCNDADACTTGDQCTGGQCGGTPKDCSGLDTQCADGTCNPQTGQCGALPKDDGTACSDGNACTLADECTAGQCGGTAKDCSNFDTNCRDGVCVPQTGECGTLAKDNGTACNDADPCTTGDQCTGGQCGGAPKDCSASGGSCTEGQCNAQTGQCEGSPLDDGTACNDGSACTTGDQCTGGQCSGTPKDCSGLDTACRDGVCVPQTGECGTLAKENGTACDDGSACTTGDQCTGGQCAAGAPKDCSQLDQECQQGACNPQSGQCEAVVADDGTPCNDGAFCTATDTCKDGSCNGTGDPCNGDAACGAACDEARDTCSSEAGTPCTDDGNPCTDDTCDGEGTCAHVANEGACDDGLFCTTGDHCAGGECVGDPTCPEAGACTNTCSEAEDSCLSCGKPFSSARCVVNAVFVLQGSLELRDCDLCTCDVDSSGTVTASDALRILRGCADLPVQLDCPSVDLTTTTSPTTTTFLP